MTRAIPLRTDYTAADLRRLSRSSSDSKQTRRLLSLARGYLMPELHQSRSTSIKMPFPIC